MANIFANYSVVVKVVTMYPIDIYSSFRPTVTFLSTPHNERDFAPGAVADVQDCVTHPFNEFFNTCYSLSHLDVLSNQAPSLPKCELCLVGFDLYGYRRACDGTYPAAAGSLWPEAAMGRQFQCQRGQLCKDCDTRVGKYWLCKACQAPIRSHEDVWGHGIEQPPILQTPGALWMNSVPVGTVPVVQPADAYVAELSDRDRRQQEAHLRFERHGGEHAVQCAAAMMKLFNENNMPKALQSRILIGLHDIHDAKLLLVNPDVPVALNFPRSIDGLYNRGEARRILDADIDVTQTSFCMEAMLQTSQEVTVLRTDISKTIQSILLDEAIRPGIFLRESRNSERRQYVDAQGNRLRGTNPYHGDMWSKLLETVPLDGEMLAIVVHTDGVDSCGKSVKPVSIQLTNFPLGDGCGDRRIRCVGLGEDPSIRRPRGTKIPETLRSLQAAMKLTFMNRTHAEILSGLEGMASEGADFWVRDINGELIRVKLYPRLLYIQADMAEQQALLGLCPDDCHLCFGYQYATRDGLGTRGSNNRPHMCLDDGAFCGKAIKRTVLETARRQARIMKVARTGTVADTEELERELGVKHLVENTLSRLSSLIRHEVGGPYALMSVDVLHALRTGIVPRLCRVWDSVSIRWHSVTEDLITKEDVRHFVDDRLMQLPQQYGKPSFALGFWSGDGVGSIKGEEVTTLLELLTITFCGCDVLVSNKSVRLELLNLSRNVLIIIKEAYAPQWYTAAEDHAMSVRVKEIQVSMHKVMTFIRKPDGTYPKSVGRVFDLPKVHASQAIHHDSIMFGQLGNTDTEAGERSQRGLKAANVFVNHNNIGPNRGLMKRLVARQLDEAAASAPTQSKRVRRFGPGTVPEVSVHSSKMDTLGHGLHWLGMMAALNSGTKGPIVPLAIGDASISELIIDVAVKGLFGPLQSHGAESIAADADDATVSGESMYYFEAVTRKCVDKHVTRYNFRSSHCVLTTRGTVVQLLVPMVVRKDHYKEGRGVGVEAQCIVFDFESADKKRPLHPELPVPWLRRGKVMLMSVVDLVRRVHLCPLFGDLHRKKGDMTPNFLLNTLSDAYFEGPEGRQVFLKCNYLGCEGTLPQPPQVGSPVTCVVCAHTKQWF